MTSAQIGCLLAILELSPGGSAIASKEIAVQLHVSRPSVHRLLAALAGHGLVVKEPYGTVELSDEGRERAGLLAVQRDRIAGKMSAAGLSKAEAEKAALLLLSGLSEESAAALAGGASR